jgi:hypothetical protein
MATSAGYSACAQEAPPVRVLSDTVEYCTHLQQLVQERPARPPDVNKLFADGRRMCEHGEVRRGVSRLRNALWLLNHRNLPR